MNEEHKKNVPLKLSDEVVAFFLRRSKNDFLKLDSGHHNDEIVLTLAHRNRAAAIVAASSRDSVHKKRIKFQMTDDKARVPKTTTHVKKRATILPTTVVWPPEKKCQIHIIYRYINKIQKHLSK